MKNRFARLTASVGMCLVLSAGFAMVALARLPEGYRDIKLGMDRSHVLGMLKKSTAHFSYEELGNEIGEIIRGDDLFRYATYRFDAHGILVEIDLQMREVLGRDKVIDLFNSRHGVKISPLQRTVLDNLSIEVRDNALLMKMTQPTETRAENSRR